MIRLTKSNKTNKSGETVDDSIYLDRFDSRNMCLMKLGAIDKRTGKQAREVIGYYGSVKSALARSIDIVIKDGGETLELPEVLQRINALENRIEELYEDLPTMIQLMKEGK